MSRHSCAAAEACESGSEVEWAAGLPQDGFAVANLFRLAARFAWSSLSIISRLWCISGNGVDVAVRNRTMCGALGRSTSDDNVNDLLLRVPVLGHATPGRQRGDHLIHGLAVCNRPACDAGQISMDGFSRFIFRILRGSISVTLHRRRRPGKIRAVLPAIQRCHAQVGRPRAFVKKTPAPGAKS